MEEEKYIVIHKEDNPNVTGPINFALSSANKDLGYQRFTYKPGYDSEGLCDRFLNARELVEGGKAGRILCILDVMHGQNREAGIEDLVRIGEAMKKEDFYQGAIYAIGFLTSVPQYASKNPRVQRFDPRIPVYVWGKDTVPGKLGRQLLERLESEVLSLDPKQRLKNLANRWRPQ